MINIPEFNDKSELFTYLRTNKDLHIQAKKSAFKCADAIDAPMFAHEGETITKAAIDPTILEADRFNVLLAINTTNLMDSHSDVHIPGLWKKSLKETKPIYLLQEHKMEFKSIISDLVKASAVTMTWKELGYKFDGETQVLLFGATIEKERNEYMAEQYAKGRVKNHSVGMRYVNILLCMNSDSKWDEVEKANYDKYITQVANKDEAEQQGYFWAVLEAKLVEGSAVPMGSNFATPTISIGKTTQEPPQGTQEPEKSTQKNALSFLFD